MSVYYVDGAVGNDANAGTSPGSGNAWATLAHAAATATSSVDLVYVKASATYTLTSAVNWASAGVTVRGYGTTPGAEDGHPLITTATNSTRIFTIGADDICFRQLSLSNTAGTRAEGICTPSGTRNRLLVLDCILDGFTKGLDSDFTTNFEFVGTILWRVEAKNCSTFGICGAVLTAAECYIHDNTGDGWRRGVVGGNTAAAFADCVFSGNGGKNLNWDSTSAPGVLWVRSTAIRGATSDGILLGASTANARLVLENCTIETSGGYGINSSAPLPACVQKNNAFRSNTSGNRQANVPAGEGDITLTGDPYNNASSADYSTNNTAGAGAALRAAGFPGVSAFGTGYRDVGPLQHQDAGGGGTTTYVINKSINNYYYDSPEP